MKVAAYCRVSTDYEDQTNPFENQKRFFKDYIERQPDWELYEIYSDEGLSETSTENRPGFNRMIEYAKAGKFDLILTKEVSRFARNTMDTLHYTRDLKRIGVGVMFMYDRIYSMNPEAEFFLTLMASLIQEESIRLPTVLPRKCGIRYEVRTDITMQMIKEYLSSLNLDI